MSGNKRSGFSSEKLLEVLPPLEGFTRLWVAFSGGCDSHALLHALASARSQLPVELKAVHVDHSLNPSSDRWARHCQSVCNALGVDCGAIKVDANPVSGESPEAAARKARYNAFRELLQDQDCICTAHHQNDQAETLLLQLLRGAGPKGMAAMPSISQLGAAQLIRPLLHFTREELEEYAGKNQLNWIEDPSNAETGYNRNYIRHSLMPVLQQRWPAANKVISRSASHCAEVADLLEELAEADMVNVRGETLGQLNIAELTQLSLARQKNLLRYWIHQQGLPLPSDIKLQHILSDVIPASPDANPCVQWPGAEVRRYQGVLYAVGPVVDYPPDLAFDWDGSCSLALPDGSALSVSQGGGRLALDADKLRGKELTIRFRRAGAKIRPNGRQGNHSLKKLLQEAQVPPWLRARQPLLYVGEELVAVVGVCVADGWSVSKENQGLVLSWQGAEG